MDLIRAKQRWKLVLAVMAIPTVGASLWYSNRIGPRKAGGTEESPTLGGGRAE
ncbi:MAG: hypothetical protein IPO87_13860 [Flavobacteriales bacterium]|nr:hypothetical protein [Flavobacteriales bacterium]